jgi:hypothetical protein
LMNLMGQMSYLSSVDAAQLCPRSVPEIQALQAYI